MITLKHLKVNETHIFNVKAFGVRVLRFLCLTPRLTTFQLYRGGALKIEWQMHEITQNYTNVAYYICFTPRILEANSYIAI